MLLQVKLRNKELGIRGCHNILSDLIRSFPGVKLALKSEKAHSAISQDH